MLSTHLSLWQCSVGIYVLLDSFSVLLTFEKYLVLLSG